VDLACLTGTDSTLTSPTWSPDGRSLAFAHADGIEVLPLPNVEPGDCPGATSSRLVIPGGQEPDWSPAPVDANAGSYSPASGSNAGGSTPVTKPSQRMKISVPRSLRLSQALRKGVVIRVTGPAAGRVAARATLGSRAAGSAGARLRKAGRVTLRVRISRAGASYLRRHRSAKLVVRLTFTPKDGRPSSASARVRITR
jgi:hypothetical protein